MAVNQFLNFIVKIYNNTRINLMLISPFEPAVKYEIFIWKKSLDFLLTLV